MKRADYSVNTVYFTKIGSKSLRAIYTYLFALHIPQSPGKDWVECDWIAVLLWYICIYVFNSICMNGVHYTCKIGVHSVHQWPVIQITHMYKYMLVVICIEYMYVFVIMYMCVYIYTFSYTRIPIHARIIHNKRAHTYLHVYHAHMTRTSWRTHYHIFSYMTRTSVTAYMHVWQCNIPKQTYRGGVSTP